MDQFSVTFYYTVEQNFGRDDEKKLCVSVFWKLSSEFDFKAV